jgi:redox-sensing transcriptional repressor
VARLSRYRTLLYRYKSYGAAWVLSNELAGALGATPAQVRKDFSMFEMAGKKKMGYSVHALINRLDHVLGRSESHQVILGGAGPLGRLLVSESLFDNQGINITAAFEGSPQRLRDAAAMLRIPVLPLNQLIAFVKQHGIRVGIIATTDGSAQRILDEMVLAGIQGVLNLSPMELKSPKSCYVSTVNIFYEFEKVLYFVRHGAGRKMP